MRASISAEEGPGPPRVRAEADRRRERKSSTSDAAAWGTGSPKAGAGGRAVLDLRVMSSLSELGSHIDAGRGGASRGFAEMPPYDRLFSSAGE
jgi:hypothetical protein